LNELTAVSGPGLSASYGYDPLGNLVSQTVGGITSNYQVAPTGIGSIVAAFNGSGSLMSHYTYGLGLTSQVTASGTAAYYDFNNIGSTVGITGTNGSYLNQYSYLPFGQTIIQSAALTNPFTFVGRFGVLANGTGLIRLDHQRGEQAEG
jgi:hypothetical protein